MDSETAAISVGVPICNLVAKIVDLEKGGRELGPGEIGEIIIKGPGIIPGYWLKAEETKVMIS